MARQSQRVKRSLRDNVLILEKFYGEEYGAHNRPKLVFLHGLMGSAANWRSVISSFENQFHVLAYDQRGHGRSFKPESGYDPEDFAGDLREILDHLGWERIHLVGHSMGGRNALRFAYESPERVERLVVEDIGPEISEKGAQRIRELLDSVPTPFDSRSAARSFFQNNFEDLHPANPRAKAVGQYLYTNIVESEGGRADWRFHKEGILHAASRGRATDRWTEVESLKMPTLWVRGAESVEFPQTVYEEILTRNSIIEGQVIEESGHWVHFDQTAKFVATISDFFSR